MVDSRRRLGAHPATGIIENFLPLKKAG